MTAGTSPIRTSEKANFAVLEVTTMSHAASNPRPPARAAPPTLATTGFGQWVIACRIRGTCRIPSEPGTAVAFSFRSIPEQKAGPVWVRITTRAVRLASAAARAVSSWARSAVDRALRLAGESRVMVNTPASSTVCTRGCTYTGFVIWASLPRSGPCARFAPQHLARAGWSSCPPLCPRAIRSRSTARCPTRPTRDPLTARCPSICTFRSAPPAAATAISTPIRPVNWAAALRRTPGSRPRRRRSSWPPG